MTERLSREQWLRRQDEHRAAVNARVAEHEWRQGRGIAHPVEDFLFTYYQHRPNQLRRWHPGAGVVLADATDAPHRDWPHYRRDGDDVTVDLATGRIENHTRDAVLEGQPFSHVQLDIYDRGGLLVQR